jgi:hypothetical protein
MEGCPKCGQAARADRLARHREKVHGSKMGQDKREQELAAQLAAAWDARLNQPSKAVDKQLRKTQEPGKVQCPHCHAAILEKRLQKHMRKVHPRRAPCPGCGQIFNARKRDWKAHWPFCSPACRLGVKGAPPRQEPGASGPPSTVSPMRPDKNSAWLFRENRMGKRSSRVLKQSQPNPKDFKPDLGNIPTARLSFKLLPPGTWDFAHVIEYYQGEAKQWLGERELQADRVNELKTLKPSKCYVGSELWRGYILLEFGWSKSVVLECPVEGNATYVLSGDWNRMASLTKGALRAQFPKNYTKVVHKGIWLRHRK